MQLRRFRPGDEAALHRVHFSAVHVTAARDYTPEQLEAWAPATADQAAWAMRMQGINPFVVEINGIIAGYADVQPTGYIDHFFVSAEFPRQGVGRCLMEHILKEAARLELSALTSDVSRTAQPFFERFGFRVIEQRQPVRHGLTIPNALMRKDLLPRSP
jgi:putative acetyltransferase